jgi:peptidylprolyl isomerase
MPEAAVAKKGDTVAVHYAGTLPDGTLFDSSRGQQPLEFTIGAGMVVPGFEQAVVGMTEGETKKEVVASEEAYGPRRDELVVPVGRQEIPTDVDLEIGKRLKVRTAAGQTLTVRIAEVTEENVTLDANHPLAGRDLTFEIELVEIKAA